MSTVLLIEDDEGLGGQVVAQLEQCGFTMVWRKTGAIVREADLAGTVLLILDLMLPGMDGMDILKQVRKMSDVPVLVLSARQDARDKTRALKLGADDYLTKPFWPAELIERVNARVRRPVLVRASDLRVGALSIRSAKRSATYQGRELQLTRVEFDLLTELARRAGQPISRQWLLSNVLDPDKEATERTLDVHVSRIRKKLGDSDLIETVWGIGYRLRAGETSDKEAAK